MSSSDAGFFSDPCTNATLASVRRSLIAELKKAGIENNAGEADLILIRLLCCTRAAILGHPEKILTQHQIASAKAMAERRASGEPLQYILGEAFFYGRSFGVGKGVLIPRPETELLTELALEYLAASASSSRAFLDWGTGSGCIAVTLLLENPGATAFMAEKNPESLLQAWENAKRHDVLSRCLLWHSQNPDDIPVAESALDLVVSNPPYIPTQDIAGLMREVRDHEPRLALDGGEDGMDCYRLLFRYAPRWLKPEGVLLFEIGDEIQAAAMKEMDLPSFVFLKEIRDLNEKTRCMAWRYRG